MDLAELFRPLANPEHLLDNFFDLSPTQNIYWLTFSTTFQAKTSFE